MTQYDKTYKIRIPQIEIKKDEYVIRNDRDTLTDEEWVNLTINADTDNYDSDILKFQYRSPVFTELMDTSIGGHFTLNPPYGFTPTADIYYTGRNADAVDYSPEKEAISIGQGRYYSEAIQMNSKVRTLTIEAGVAEFRSFFSFFATSVDRVKISLARTGRTPWFYYAGRAIGTAMVFLAFPILSAAIIVTKFILNDVLHLFNPNYYYLKPTMGTFFSTVNTIANTFAADRNILGPFDFDHNKYKSKDDRMGYPLKLNKEDQTMLSNMMPHIFKKTGLIDVAGIAGRHQTLISKQIRLEQQAEKEGSFKKLNGQIHVEKEEGELVKFNKQLRSLEAYAKEDPYAKAQPAAPDTSENKATSPSGSDKSSSKNIDNDEITKISKDEPRYRLLESEKTGFFKSAAKYYRAAIENGTDSVSIQVEYNGETSFTINNGVVDIPTKAIVNQVSSKVRSAYFSMSDGNIAGGTVKKIMQAGLDVVSGVIESVTFGLSNVASALNGGGYIKFPKMWDNSSFSVSGHTFKVRLNSPYNNPISHMMDLDLVLATILGFSAPLEVGRSSYTSPFLCKAFIRGVMNINLGIVTSVNISTAGGKMGHNVFGAVNDLVITFTILDLEDVISMPVPSGVMGLFEVSLDEYSGLNRMSKLITGQSLAADKFLSRRALLRLNKAYGAVHQLFSPEMWGTKLGNSTIGNIHSLFVQSDISSTALFDD